MEVELKMSDLLISKNIVNSHNEWDLLEEVIVGNVYGACIPSYDITLEATMPINQLDTFKIFGGNSFPKHEIESAKRDLDEFIHILKSEGVVVKRPDPVNHCRSYSTPNWHSKGGLYAAMPRDILLVIGNEIIESPMSWRSRYFEVNAFKGLLKDYFRLGAKWTSAPKPELKDELYNHSYKTTTEKGSIQYVISEFEPTFDAADFIKFGKDIFVQKSHVTNDFGINWLRRHIGEKYKIHVLETNDLNPMHIDATIMPLAEGKLLVNKSRLKNIPEIFKSWDILYAPEPCMSPNHKLYMTSRWINMNVLSLDEERVIVEKGEESMIKALKKWGFKPIPCSFKHFNTFGGSFHCATVDIRRKGELKSYF